MVLKEIVSLILNKYIQKYVKNFDSRKLKIDILAGKAELTDIELQDEALADLDLPIEVLDGYIGKLTLNIPWRSIYVDPVEIEIEDILVIAGPQKDRPYDAKKEKRYTELKKQKQLKTIEKGKKYQEEREKSEDQKKDDTLFEKLQAQILKNVQICIRNIHVRYEDKVTTPESPFAIGVTLSEIKAKTTDRNWIPIYVDGSVRKIYKLIEMGYLGLYWNNNVSVLISGLANWKSLMKSQITSQTITYNHDFVLEPLSMTVHMEVDQDAKVQMELPKYVVKIILEKLPLSLSKSQFQGIVKLADSLSMMEVNQEFKKFRPLDSVHENPGAWWKYCFNSINETTYKPWTWENIKAHRVEYKKYVRLYQKKLKEEYLGHKKSLTSINRLIEEQEALLDVANILIGRQQASNEFEVEKESGLKDEDPEQPGWWEWFGFTSPDVDTPDDTEASLSLSKLTEEEKDELFIAIGYVNDTTHPVYAPEYIRSKLTFTLESCDVTLKDPDKNASVTLNMKKLLVIASERPGSEGLGFNFKVENITSKQIHQDNTLDVIKSRERREESLLYMDFQVNPLDSTAYYSLKLSVSPIDVIFYKKTLDILTDMFYIEDDGEIQELQQSANEKVEELTNASRAGIDYLVTNNKVLYLDFNVHSPTIIIPNHSGNLNEVIEVYLGDLSVKTNMKSESHKQIAEATESDLEEMFYHQTDIVLSKIYVGMTQYENGKLKEIVDEKFIIPPICFNLNVSNSLKKGYVNYPDFKISGELPLVKVNLKEESVMHIYQVLEYFVGNEQTKATGKFSDMLSNSSLSRHKKSGSTISELTNLQDLLCQSTRQPKGKQKELVTSEDSDQPNVETELVGKSESYNSDIVMFDRTKLAATFEVKKIELTYELLNGDVIDLLNLSITAVSVDVQANLWDVTIKAKVHLFELSEIANGEKTSIIKSVESKEMIQFSLIQADSAGPQFQSKFNRIESSISLECSGITLYGRPISLKKIKRNVESLVDKLQSMPETVKHLNKEKSGARILEVIHEDEEFDVEAKKSLNKLEETVMGKTLFKFHFNMNFIGLVLISKENKDLAEMFVKDISSSVEIKTDQTEIFARLNDLQLLDKSPDTLYPEILKDNSKNVLDSKVVLYNNVSKDCVSSDIELEVQVGKIDVTANVAFFVSVYSILMEIVSENEQDQKQIKIKLTSPALLPIMEVQQDFSKIRVKLDVQAPNIIIPRTQTEKDHLNVDLGCIVLKNDIMMENEHLFDNIEIGLEQINITSFSDNTHRDMLIPFSVQAKCKRSLNLEQPTLSLNMEMSLFKIKIFGEDVTLIVDAIKNSFDCLKSLDPFVGGAIEVPSTSQVVEEKQDNSNLLTLEVHIDVPKVVLDAFNDDDHDNPLLSLISDNFSLVFKQSSQMKVGFTLQDISLLENHTQKNRQPLALFTSKSENNIASFEYLVDEKGNQDIHLGVTDISMNANDVSMKNIALYLKSVLKRLQPLSNLNSSKQVAPTGKSVISDSSKSSLKFNCQLDRVSLWWDLNQVTFAKAQMTGLNFILETNVDGLKVKTKMENLIVEDLREEILYPKIVLMEDENLLACEFSLKDLPDLKCGSLWLRIGRVKVVFLNKFIVEIMESIQPFIELASLETTSTVEEAVLQPSQVSTASPSQPSQVSTASPSQPSQVSTASPSQPFLLELDIHVTAPLISFPELSTSANYITADLGTLAVTNIFQKVEESERMQERKQVLGIDTIKAQLTNMKLMMCNGGKESVLSKDLSINVNLKRKVFKDDTQLDLNVNVGIVPVVVILADTDIQLLMTLLQSNLGEGNTISNAQSKGISPTTSDIIPEKVIVDVHQTERSEVDEIDEVDAKQEGKRNEPENIIRVIVTCELLQLHLQSNLLFKEQILVDVSDYASVQMCIFSISKLSASFSMIGDREMDLELNIREISGEDVRPHSSASFKRVLERRIGRSKSLITYNSVDGVEKSNKDQLSIHYHSKDYEQEVSILVVDARMFVNLEFLHDLLEFFGKVFSDDESTKDDKGKEQETATAGAAEDVTTETNASKQPVTVNKGTATPPEDEVKAATETTPTNEAVHKKARTNEFKLTCKLNDTEAILLKDPQKSITPSIIGHLQVDLTYQMKDNKTMMEVPHAVIGILYGEYPQLRETTRPLLLPCRMESNIVMSEDGGVNISVFVEEMKFSLSPSILSTLLQIADNFTVKTDEYEEKKVCTYFVDWSSKELTPQVIEEPIDSSFDFSMESKKVENTLKKSNEKVEVKLKMIELTLGNDLEEKVVPLLLTKFSSSTKIANWTGQIVIETDLTIELRHYNEKIGAWEPFLEPDTSENSQLSIPYELNIRLAVEQSKKLDFTSGIHNDEVMNSDPFETDGQNEESSESALILIISSEEVMQLTISENTFNVVNKFVQGWTLSALRKSEGSKLVAPYEIRNQLGESVVIYIEDKEMVSLPDSNGRVEIKKRGKRIENRTSRHFNPWEMKDINKKMEIDIKVGDFEVIEDIDVSRAGTVVYHLLDKERNAISNMVVDIDVINGRRLIHLTSFIKIFNELDEEVSVTLKRDTPLLSISSLSKACIPLHCSNKKGFFIKIEGFSSEQAVDLMRMSDEKMLPIFSTNRQPQVTKYIKIMHKIIDSSEDEKFYIAPIYHVTFLPPIKLTNFLPFELNIGLQRENTDALIMYNLETGKTINVLDFDTSEHGLVITLKYSDEEGRQWNSNVVDYSLFHSHAEPKRFTMKCTELNQSQTFEMTGEQRTGLIEFTFYSAFWILNKTGLDINFKVLRGETYNLYGSRDVMPQIISYDKRKKAKGALQFDNEGWSEDFSLSAISDENHVDLYDSTKNLYSIHINIIMSNTNLTNIITLSPRCIVSNHTELNIEFGEEKKFINKVVWTNLPPGKCSPFWSNSLKSKLLMREKDSASIGSSIPFSSDCKYAKRLSTAKTVCIDVNHLGERLIMNVTNYEEGCIPVRVDNYCSMSVFLRQSETEGLAAIKEYVPNSSQFYNWVEFDKPYQLRVMYGNPDGHEKHVNVERDDWGKHNIIEHDVVDFSIKEDTECFVCKCCSCFMICKKQCTDREEPDHGGATVVEEEKQELMISPTVTDRPRPEEEANFVYWVSYLEGMQRVIAFTTDFIIAKKLYKVGDLEYVNMEVFVSLQGIGISLLNKQPIEIVYASLTGGTSIWEVEKKEGKWKMLDVDTSMVLESSWKKNEKLAKYENKIEADIGEMVMVKPHNGKLRRSRDPALWVEFRKSKNNCSVYVKLHRIQVDSQQYDVLFPIVLYPTPLPEKIVARNGAKPMIEFSAVFSQLQDVMIFKYFKLILQEVNLKIDRPILTGLISLYTSDIRATNQPNVFEEDTKYLSETTEERIEQILVSQSIKVLILYFHLSPIKIHLSFSMEGSMEDLHGVSTEAYFLEWLINTVGIHFTDISDAEIKLAFFERKNVLLSQDMLLADVTKHYTLQAIKQFHKFVLGLDALGNPYGLLTDYGKGFKDLFYEPYLGRVGGPQFAAGLATGIKSLLGHTIGGTAGAAALITERLGDVVVAFSFDSDYKRRRRQEMINNPSGIGEGLAMGGKQFVMGLVFGVSGLVTKPVQGARRNGVEGFFKGIGKGLIGLLVKPTGGVIDLVSNSLDGVRRFSEQGGEDIVARMRLPRLTYPHEPVTAYSNEKSHGYNIFRGLTVNRSSNIEGRFKDHQVVTNEPATIVIFTTFCTVLATQTRFFSDWTVSWVIRHASLIDVCIDDVTVIFRTKGEHEEIIHVTKTEDGESLVNKTKNAWNQYKEVMVRKIEATRTNYVIIT